MEKDDDNSFSPSFSTYSGDRLAEIADRVGRSIAEEDDDEDFEFEILQTPSSSSSPVFPVFNQNLMVKKPEAVMTPLEDLFLRDPPEQLQQRYSSSSDEEDEAIPSEIYCPWTPARSTAEMSTSGGCRKSKSTGSSSTKRWRIRDLLLKRSHSDGKQSLKFMDSVKKKDEKVSPHEKFYLRNKAIKEEDKKKSYLPYKQQLVGLFTNIHRYAKTSHP